MAYTIYEGLKHTDERGSIKFFNTLNMKEIVRMYEINPASTSLVRAWQGHKFEKKWFYCSEGSFVINLLKIDDFNNPSSLLVPEKIVLDSSNPVVLEISGGYATGIQAINKNSKLMVYSDFSLDQSKNDDYRFPVDQWDFIK
ncbi:hypothetical protein [Maribacter hydrothermalis]|uniref:dTDP-4-dehydrorhamnose 3,5-epimerase n=1 Tax=Maribacter hydrothermalis TaxID=1836467 RepID=A0A1B7ZDB2_9FLAO|nr:hypothetical protein [Maribacter hydrothermalis]APQ18501.1 hypothetical protein BTR34_14770 [Maribacter hydrothermalis]OBR41292.1 hypothetical protein A9200_13325 [Maribacter hydrothermalis]